jgi:hypothetical protein
MMAKWYDEGSMRIGQYRRAFALPVMLALTGCAVDPYLQSGLQDAGGDATDSSIVANDSMVPMDAPPDVPPHPKCNGGVCVDAVPNGWTGPLVLDDDTGSPPACPSAYPSMAYNGNRSPNAPAAQCGCTCGSVNGATCGAPDVSIYDQSQCQSFCNKYSNVSSCQSTSSCNTGSSVRGTPGQASGGSCSKTPSKTVPNWSWGKNGRACGGATLAMGCMGSAVCAPAPSAPFAAVCIQQTGDVACPGGTYSQKYVFYGGYTDSRDCTTCNCDQPNGVMCTGGTVTIWDASSCQGSYATIAVDGSCHSAGGTTTISVKQATAATASGGSCNKSNGAGQPSGQFTPTTPTTLCCNQ